MNKNLTKIELKNELENENLDVNRLFDIGKDYFLEKNNPKTAIKYFKKVVELDGSNNNAKVCLGLSYLKTKNYKDGWNFFEYRLNNLSQYSKIAPNWNGEELKDKTILVYAERGFGDTIMFSRFLPQLEEKFKNVHFLPQIELFELFNKQDWNINVINQLKDFDVHTSVMSLPLKLNINNEIDIPSSEKYLKADKNKVKIFKEKYFNTNNTKVGINWQGCMDYELKRAIPIENFYKLLDIKNISFYSLQKEHTEKLSGSIIDLGTSFNDFSDTAAAIQNLDLIITNDTSIAHLAGAMGKPCWVLLPYVQDWRWSDDLSYSVWYKSVKLFKQNSVKDWQDVFENVKKMLKTISN